MGHSMLMGLAVSRYLFNSKLNDLRMFQNSKKLLGKKSDGC